jgi:ABC-type multidrug transport system fused ATPase/permease subunit
VYYSYAFSIGRMLVLSESVKNKGEPYTGGDVAACMVGIIIGAVTLGASMPNLKAIVEGQISGHVVYSIIEREPLIPLNDQTKKAVDKEKLRGEIAFENVSFRYPTRPDQPILRDFSAVFKAGQTTAIVGPSGSGKSTIIQLIERFYDPDGGRVLIDGDDILSLNLKSLRNSIGYVSQEPVLFNTSIRENLRFGKPEATDDEIVEALKNANAYDFIVSKMGKDGISTKVGNSGG